MTERQHRVTRVIRVTGVFPVPAAPRNELLPRWEQVSTAPGLRGSPPRPPHPAQPGPTCDDQVCGVVGAPELVFREAGVNASVRLRHVGYLEPPVFQKGDPEGDRNRADKCSHHIFYRTSSGFPTLARASPAPASLGIERREPLGALSGTSRRLTRRSRRHVMGICSKNTHAAFRRK